MRKMLLMCVVVLAAVCAWADDEIAGYTEPTHIGGYAVEKYRGGSQVKDARPAMRVSHPPPSLVFELGDGVKLEMVGVGVGSYVMGVSQKEPMLAAMIGHKVSFMDPYWIGKFEVTQEQFSRVFADYDFSPAGTNLPACGVSWDDAMMFADALNDLFADRLPAGFSFTLPTEAQWEYACRAGHVEDLGNGARLTESWQRAFFDISHRGEAVEALEGVAWYEANSGHTLHPVGLKEPNAWGLYDMHGNVSEWCLDWNGDPHEYLIALYYGNNVIDQQGPTNGVNKVLRGGNYLSMPGACASWSRTSQTPDLDAGLFPKKTVGFRIAIARPAQEYPDVQDGDVYGSDKTTEDMLRLNALTKRAKEAREDAKRVKKEHLEAAERRRIELTKRIETIRYGLEAERRRRVELAKRSEDVRLDVKRESCTAMIFGVLKTALQIARPVVEFQLNRGVQAAMGQKVGKPWEGFAERIAEDWDFSDDVEIVVDDDGGVKENRPKGLPTIKGKSILKECESSTYQLYIGGTKITSGVEWAPAGTSITVSNAGSHARAMAGNPPVRSGSFKTGIKATYNGKTYRKWISIQKTGKSAVVNKYKKRKNKK